MLKTLLTVWYKFFYSAFLQSIAEIKTMREDGFKRSLSASALSHSNQPSNPRKNYE
jgi:hypothetical protein